MMLLKYYEPADNHKELANKLLEVLHSPRNKSSLLAISERYLQKYTPKAQAGQFLSLMEGLLREG
jgi:glycosyltransferase involved in cell wall biosynthesis